MKKRIEYLDTAKGILIIMMLIGHVWNDGFVHDFVYAFHMPAFFIISGILFNYSSSLKKKSTQYIIAKIKALLIPYLVYEIYAIVIHILMNGWTLNVKGFMYEILSLHLFNGPLWFLMVLFLSEIIFYYFVKVLK